jgi:hypothetical protein
MSPSTSRGQGVDLKLGKKLREACVAGLRPATLFGDDQALLSKVMMLLRLHVTMVVLTLFVATRGLTTCDRRDVKHWSMQYAFRSPQETDKTSSCAVAVPKSIRLLCLA